MSLQFKCVDNSSILSGPKLVGISENICMFALHDFVYALLYVLHPHARF